VAEEPTPVFHLADRSPYEVTPQGGTTGSRPTSGSSKATPQRSQRSPKPRTGRPATAVHERRPPGRCTSRRTSRSRRRKGGPVFDRTRGRAVPRSIARYTEPPPPSGGRPCDVVVAGRTHLVQPHRQVGGSNAALPAVREGRTRTTDTLHAVPPGQPMGPARDTLGLVRSHCGAAAELVSGAERPDKGPLTALLFKWPGCS
jgi:hypothetical protein